MGYGRSRLGRRNKNCPFLSDGPRIATNHSKSTSGRGIGGKLKLLLVEGHNLIAVIAADHIPRTGPIGRDRFLGNVDDRPTLRALHKKH
jgi:hypothetical protein